MAAFWDTRIEFMFGAIFQGFWKHEVWPWFGTQSP